MNVPDQVDERKDKIPMQTSQQSWLSISQKMKKIISVMAEKTFQTFINSRIYCPSGCALGEVKKNLFNNY